MLSDKQFSTVLRSIVNGLLRRKGMSTDARDYASDQHPIP